MRRFLYFFIPFIMMISAELLYINYRLNNLMNDLEIKQNRIERQFLAVENDAINLTVKYTLLRDRFNDLKRERTEPVMVDSRRDSSISKGMIMAMNN
ncbi:MAG: hypothetical protein AB7W47_01080 [Calditrichaceae bacterium]